MKDSNKIVLTKSDPRSGAQHHVIPLDWVEAIDEKLRLKKFAKDAIAQRQREIAEAHPRPFI